MATYLLRNRVALLRVASPPVNSLGLAARQGLADGLRRAAEEGAVAVVLAGEGSTFPAGADISEFAAGVSILGDGAPARGDLDELATYVHEAAAALLPEDRLPAVSPELHRSSVAIPKPRCLAR